MIDDGLHNLDSILNTFKEFYSIQEDKTWIVIEDIEPTEENISAWQIVGHLISSTNVSFLVKCRKSILFCSFKGTVSSV
jgi:hypothetical protein